MKHIELFKDGFDFTVQEKIQPENWSYIGRDMVTGEIIYTVVPETDTINYFYIESLEDNNVITFDETTWIGYGNNKSKLEVSINGSEWFYSESIKTLTLNTGDKARIRCIKDNICKSNEEEVKYPLFKTSAKCNIGGNINTIMFDYTIENPTLSEYAFAGLFTGGAEDPDTLATPRYNYIVDASKLVLPAMVLANNCYYSMFIDCTSLIAAPELPATILADYCYLGMFGLCTSLTTAPELPATTLAEHCYEHMFTLCTSLTTSPKLPATTLAEHCYSYMFHMCTSLTTAPELPAATLAKECYYSMFENCANLNYVKCLATDISAEYCTVYWIWNVSSNGTFVKHPNMNDWITNYAGIPEGWTVVDADI